MNWKLTLDVDIEGADGVDIETLTFALLGANPLCQFPVTGLSQDDVWAELHVNQVNAVLQEPEDD